MNLPTRKPTRLKYYDYSTPGAYFITVCVKDKVKIFGEIKNNSMHLNEICRIVNDEILNIERHYENIKIDKYIIMPNHVHLIITIVDMS